MAPVAECGGVPRLTSARRKSTRASPVGVAEEAAGAGRISVRDMPS